MATTTIGTVLGGRVVTADFVGERVRKPVTVTRNPSGTWTAAGPHTMRDFATRAAAVKFLKRAFADKSNKAEWAE